METESLQLLQDCENEAKSLSKRGQFKEVEDLYTGVIKQLEKCPHSDDRKRSLALAHNSRGLSHYKQVNFDEAVEDYNAALEYDPSLACAYYNRATVIYRLCTGYELDNRLEKLECAMEDFTKAVELQPDNVEFEEGKRNCESCYESTKGGVKVTVDGSDKGEVKEPDFKYSDIPECCQNITAVHYEMDKIVASATLPERYAFRIPNAGSVYVDTVCSLLEKHRGYNITQVLEKACRKMHQILFSAASNEFSGEAKQACHYESTLQKTFIVPEV